MNTDIILDWILITPEGALAVVLSTIVMYLLFLIASRIIGARLFTGLTSVDMSAALIIGAIVGRATLGPGPTLSAGVIAFVTLVVLQGALGVFAHVGGARIVNNRPILLVAGTQVLEDAMSKTRITRDELQSKMRMAGIQSIDQISAVVLEPTGAISVLRSDRLIDHGLIDDVVGREKIPRHLIRWSEEAGSI
ncbi:DUF421 domain-containing protein [Flaviflexus huanghaiensis]|uniref:DUF421 domain-containing protein n=1 Tax=Flaviflexus huanghaiensis TaxID=1111473 RepID=UPI0015F7DF14|nr:YetF domain-containing protein [Flaviflexus huanghaiensis]